MTSAERQAIKDLTSVHEDKVAAAQRTTTEVHATVVATAKGWTRSEGARAAARRPKR